MEEYGFPQLGYDDITEEQVFISAGRTVTESDVVQFAGLTGDMNELHTNEQYAAGTPFGTRIVHGMLTLAIANGLYMRMNIFEKNTPLHDGAVTMKGNRVTAATCYLPLSDNMKLSKELGTRHRAGVGASEATDAFVIIVSEESGKVSVARSGALVYNVDSDYLRSKLSELIIKKKKGGRQ